MAFYLSVKSASGATSTLIAVNVNNRVDVYSSAGVAAEITNSPDASPSAGGKFPVYDAAGTEYLIDYIESTSGTGIVDNLGAVPGEAGQGGRGVTW